jgi:RNA:NAD 2'-phosphotransferase (TPT1/KptA family)
VGVQAVEADNKKRFGLAEDSEGALIIRAVQGHTIKVSTLLVLIVDVLLWQIFTQYV